MEARRRGRMEGRWRKRAYGLEEKRWVRRC